MPFYLRPKTSVNYYLADDAGNTEEENSISHRESNSHSLYNDSDQKNGVKSSTSVESNRRPFSYKIFPRLCSLEGCRRKARAGGPWFCSMAHYKAAIPRDLWKLCRIQQCERVALKGTLCESHVTRTR
ncbi:hypothetical protein NQZ79_g1611 [Umbelopsis isabellina]|nr:hypothetical protein NQZ79_g1611 [Umbelopsis isabellina]